MKRLLALLPLAALAACSTTQPASTAVGQAATTPLSDLNLVQAEIPPVLKEAQKAPYAMPADRACPALAAQVRALDEALGPDLDAPPNPDQPGLLERGAGAAGDALRHAAEGVVPFRGWVRKLSGAERYSREVAAAITAGGVRRAFLKGVARAGSCPG